MSNIATDGFGSLFVPLQSGGGGGGLNQLTGDVTAGPGVGSQPASVVALRGNPVSSAVPTDGQVLTWNGSAWVPGAAASGGSGGGGLVYFCNAGTAGGAPIVGLPGATKQFGVTADVAPTTITSGVLPTGGVFAIVAGFVTDPGAPGLTAIPAGVWDFNVWAQSSAVAPNSVIFRFKVYKYDGLAPTLLATGAATPIYDPTSLVQYVSSVILPQTPLLVTDRVYVEIEATSTIAGQTVSFDFGASTPTHSHTTLPSVSGTGLVHVIAGVVQAAASPVDLTAGATEISGVLPLGNGGTGTSTVPANGELLIGNGAGYSVATLTAGPGVGVTNAAGSITLSANKAVLGSIGAAPTAASLRLNGVFVVAPGTVSPITLPAMLAGDDGLQIKIANNLAGSMNVVPPGAGISRAMSAGGGQEWVWVDALATWICTSNV